MTTLTSHLTYFNILQCEINFSVSFTIHSWSLKAVYILFIINC